MNIYGTLAALKREIGKVGTGDDAVLLRALERASREIDGSAQRQFYAEVATRYFDGDGSARIAIDDVLSISDLAVDVDGDGTYETAGLTMGVDYWLLPSNPLPHTPYTHLELMPTSGILRRWPKGRRRIRISGVFGYSYETEPTGQAVLNPVKLDAGDTVLIVASTADISPGETLIIESEQVYVREVASSTNLTVVRAINGTTDAPHANGVEIYRRRYDRLVEEAAIVRAADVWRGTQTGYGQVAAAELGGFQSTTAYAQFKALVWQVSRRPVGVY